MGSRRQFLKVSAACVTTGLVPNVAQANNPPEANTNLIRSVVDFGAFGDGIQDDTNAIQKCIDYVIKHGGGTVFFPNGNYVISRAETDKISVLGRPINHCLKVEGDNVHLELNENSTLKIAGGQASDGKITAIRVGDKTGETGNNFKLSGFGKIDANWRAQTTEPKESLQSQILHSAAIVVSGKSEKVIIENISITGSKGDAILLAGVDVSHDKRLKNVTISNVTIDDCAEGIVWVQADNVKILNSKINVFLQDGIEPAKACSNYRIIGNTIESVGPKNHAIDLFGGSNGFVSHNTIYNSGINVGVGLNIHDTTENVIIQDNKLYNSSILVGPSREAVSNIIIKDNLINGTLNDHPGIRVYALKDEARISNITVENNTIENCHTFGILINRHCENILVEQNTLVGCSYYKNYFVSKVILKLKNLLGI